MDTTSNIVLAGGCFWCVEAGLKRLLGVQQAVSGYAQGRSDHPTYAQVCSGDSGHAEAVRVSYDPAQIELEALLDAFFELHDPTSLNRQGADVGTQYRSGIYVEQLQDLQRVKDWVARRQSDFAVPIVTEVEALRCFWPAEREHQDYFDLHPHQGYCQLVIRPKLDKLERSFATRLKR